MDNEIREKIAGEWCGRLCGTTYKGCKNGCEEPDRFADSILSLKTDTVRVAVVKIKPEYPMYFVKHKLYDTWESNQNFNIMSHAFSEEEKQAIKEAKFVQEV